MLDKMMHKEESRLKRAKECLNGWPIMIYFSHFARFESTACTPPSHIVSLIIMSKVLHSLCHVIHLNFLLQIHFAAIQMQYACWLHFEWQQARSGQRMK